MKTLDDHNKLIEVIESCKTKEQLSGAFKYYGLWRQKYQFWLDVGKSPAVAYFDGRAQGLFMGFIRWHHG